MAGQRVLLTVEQVVTLDAALMAAYEMHSALRTRNEMARLISRPPIPAAMSESLVGHLASWLFGEGSAVRFGGRTADLLVQRAAELLRVEVKATGPGEFQEIKQRDRQA